MENHVYRERVTPSWPSYLLPMLAGLGFVAVFLPIVEDLALLIGLGAFAVILAAQIFFSPQIIITATHLQVGRAQIELSHLGAAECFEGSAKQEQLGVKLDARAYVSIQGSAKQVIKVAVIDKKDPVPYWIFSTKHGVEILRLLG